MVGRVTTVPKGGVGSPSQQLVQEAVGAGEGRVDGHEGGDAAGVSAQESRDHGCHHVVQCAYPEGPHPAGLPKVRC